MSEPSGPDHRLLSVAASASAILDARTPEALRTILEIACERVVPVDDFEFATYDATTDRLRLVGETDSPFALHGTTWEPAVRAGRSRFATDGSEKLVVPILDGTRTLGAFRMRPARTEPVTVHEIALLDAVAALAASALLVLGRLASARAAEVAARRPDALRDALQTISSGAGGALGIEEAAGIALATICALTGFPAAHAWVLAQDEFVSSGVWQVRDLAAWGTLCTRIARRRFPHGTGLPGLVASRGRPVWLADTRTDSAFADFAKAGALGVWALPVRLGQETVAVLAFFSDQVVQRDRSLDIAAAGLMEPIAHLVARERRLTHVARTARLLDAAGPAIVASDANHRIVGWNAGAEALFGWSREDVLGRIDSDVVRTKADAEQTAEITRRLAAGQPWEGEFVVSARDGTSIPVLFSSAPVYENDGSPDGFIGVAVDLRGTHAAERHRRQAFAMDAVGRLAGAVAHDFNNLLTGIRGVAQLMLDDMPPESPLRPDLDQIATAADRAAELTSRLLAFGRRQVLRPRIVDIAELIRRIEMSLRRAAGIETDLLIDFDRPTGHIHADPTQIERAIIDLIVHARSRMPPGGTIRIRLATTLLDDPSARSLDLHAGGWVTLEVSDTGPPLPPDALERLFEPAPASAAGLERELGLGTAYGVVRQSEGVITAEPAGDIGTLLRVWLPRVRPEAAKGQYDAGSLPGGSETLLLVEDEPTVRRLAQKVLVRHGYRVLEAGDGSEALEIFERNVTSIDLVITDVIMPAMGGPELVRRLRARRPELLVLLMSGYADDSAMRRGAAHIDDAFLEKPFVPSALLRKVRDLLDSRAVRTRDR